LSARVLLCARADLFSKPGGDTQHIVGLQRALPGQTTISCELRPSLKGYDAVHVFNLSRPLEPAIQARHARSAGLPVVLTPIHQELSEYNRRGRRGAGRALFDLAGRRQERFDDLRTLVHLRRCGGGGLRELPALAALRWSGSSDGVSLTQSLQRELLASCSAVVFSSRLEAAAVHRRHRLPPTCQEHTAPVGIWPEELAALSGERFRRRFGVEGFVLSVGRIEDLKNQLALIKALRHDPSPLVLVGRVSPAQGGYAREVARAAAARPRTLLLTDLERPLALSAMAAAGVHVLPSWFESAGLASLEAAVAGCAVVSTARGFASEYLGSDATFCRPEEPGSIRSAVVEARRRGPSGRLRRRILARFTQRRTAAVVARVYEEILA
jgi:glycosyltransferase involved in cell wall biosynthesis